MPFGHILSEMHENFGKSHMFKLKQKPFLSKISGVAPRNKGKITKEDLYNWLGKLVKI